MKLTQIRNATLKVEYAGKKFLIDPMLSGKGGFPGFPGTVNSQIANPTVELPMPMSEILNVDAVIVTHTHQDHWDDTAKTVIPKHLLIFTQNARDQWDIQMSWFHNAGAGGAERVSWHNLDEDAWAAWSRRNFRRTHGRYLGRCLRDRLHPSR
jgi:L-ascorbate metabolism protein UlaG (beta-lactamase superfamily)